MGEFHEEFSELWPADEMIGTVFSIAMARKRLNDEERAEFERFLEFVGGSNTYFNELRDKEAIYDKEIVLDLDDARVWIRFRNGKIVSWTAREC